MKSSCSFIAMLVGVATLGCIPDRSSIEYAGASEPSCDSEVSGSVNLLQGSMNTALASSYVLVVKLNNNLPASSVGVGPTQTAPASRNDFVIREAEFSYTCRDSQLNCAGFRAPKPTIIQLSGFLAAGAQGVFRMPLLTSEAATAIDEWASASPATIVVGMKFRGDYVSGASAETDTINFPILIRSDPPAPCGGNCGGGTNAGESCTDVSTCPDHTTPGTACVPQTLKPTVCSMLFGLNGNEGYTCVSNVVTTPPTNP